MSGYKIYPKVLGSKIYLVPAITEDITFRELCDYTGYTFDLDYLSHMYKFVLEKPGRFTECVSMQEFDHNMFEFSIADFSAIQRYFLFTYLSYQQHTGSIKTAITAVSN